MRDSRDRMLARIRASLEQSRAQLAEMAARTSHDLPPFVHPPQDDLPAQFVAELISLFVRQIEPGAAHRNDSAENAGRKAELTQSFRVQSNPCRQMGSSRMSCDKNAVRIAAIFLRIGVDPGSRASHILNLLAPGDSRLQTIMVCNAT